MGGGGKGLLTPLFHPQITKRREEDAKSCQGKKDNNYEFLYVLEACIVFVVLLFRLYVTKLMCVKVEIARGLLKYDASRDASGLFTKLN